MGSATKNTLITKKFFFHQKIKIFIWNFIKNLDAEREI